MFKKIIFYTFLFIGVSTLSYGTDEANVESKRTQGTSSKYPVQLTYEELCQIFGLSGPTSDYQGSDIKTKTADGFLVSHKATDVQAIKIKGLLLRAKELNIVAVGETKHDMGESYTMGVGSFAQYELYEGDDLVPYYTFIAAYSKPATQTVSSEKSMSKDISSQRALLPKQKPLYGINLENYYLDCVVDVVLGVKIPRAFNLSNMQLAEFLEYSYPAFTSEENFFSILNIIKREKPEEKNLQIILAILQVLKDRNLPNGRENLKRAKNELEKLVSVTKTDTLHKDVPEPKHIATFKEQAERLKLSVLEEGTNESAQEKERHQISKITKTKEFHPLDGMSMDSDLFKDALLRRDLALSRITLRDLAEPQSKRFSMIASHASQTSQWIALQFLSLPKREDRVAFLYKMNDIYSSFINSGNFHGAMQIATALTKHAVTRVIDADKKLIDPHTDAISDVVRIEKILSEMASFANPERNYNACHEKEIFYLGTHPSCLPSFVATSVSITSLIEMCKKNEGDLNNEGERDRRLFLLEKVARLLKTASYHPTLPAFVPTNPYFTAVCTFKVHEETLEVFSDLLYEWGSARKQWAGLQPKTLEDWTPGYFADSLRQKGCAHAIEVLFKNNTCDGKDIIRKSKMKKKKLVALGGIRGLSDEMVSFIMSAPRKSAELIPKK